MAYTTNEKVKDGLPYNYQSLARTKMIEDGWIVADVFDEDGFLDKYVALGATYIDNYLGEGPYEAHGVLDDINKAYALYHIELYLISAQTDRVMSITIYNQWLQAQKLLQGILTGTIPISLTVAGDSDANSIGLVEPDNDGITLAIGDMEEDLFFGSSDATEIPE
jgi:hypothetical protein